MSLGAAGGCSRPARADADSQARADGESAAPSVASRDDAAASGNDAAAVAQFERYRAPAKVVAGLALRPGMRVADVGAGRGLLTTHLAAAVAPGIVVATDIDGAALAAIARSPSIETRLVHPDDPGLEPAAYDRILVAEVDQYLPDRAAYLARLARALKPGGFIAVSNRMPYRAPLVAAAGRAGLRATDVPLGLPGHFFVKLEPI